MTEQTGADEIIRAVESGLLDLHDLPVSESSDVLVQAFFDIVSEAVQSGSTYPLFDDQTGKLVDAAISEQKLIVSSPKVARGKHTALASDLLRRLPLFDDASVDEILSIRSEIDRYLVRFRAAVIGYSDKINSAPWDVDFPVEAEQTFLRDVRPAVADIEDAVRSNRFFAQLPRKIVDKPWTPTANSILAMSLSRLSDLPDVLSQALGALASGGLLTYDAYRDWKQKHETIEQKQLYFYYSAERRLARSGPSSLKRTS
jgi:hypothetical protein